MFGTAVLTLKSLVVGQMRQDSIESHRLMLELRARTEQQLEQQKALEKLQTTNAMLEQSKVGSVVFVSAWRKFCCNAERLSYTLFTWRLFSYSVSGITGMSRALTTARAVGITFGWVRRWIWLLNLQK